MQSFIQYRRAAVAAQAQIDRRAARSKSASPRPLYEHSVEGTAENPSPTSDRSLDHEAATQTHPPSNNASDTFPTTTADIKEAEAGSSGSSLAGFDIIPDRRVKEDEESEEVFVVKWAGPDDPLNPRNWSNPKRIGILFQLSLVTLILTAASSVDSVVIPQAAKALHVSEVAESLATALFLVGMGLGSLIAAPFSETFGRNPVYCVSMAISMIWIMASGLAPNFGLQIMFRFFAGFAASTPLVCTGGSVADMFDRAEKTWSYPLLAIFGFAGPMLGPVIGAYIGPSTVISWRWVEWSILIGSGATLVVLVFCMPETYSPVLLQWKASHTREITGDSRFRSESEISGGTLLSRLKVSMTRPFLMLAEPIIMAMTLYLTVVYIVLFTFLVGWPHIFEFTYDISQGLSNTIFVAMIIGNFGNFLLLPIIYHMTFRRFKRQPDAPFRPEIRLWWGTLGPAIALPVSLFWLAWTNYAHISIWCAILAVTLFGFGLGGIFVCVYMYIIDSYEIYAASALTFVTLVRYVVAGGMTVVGIPFYGNEGTHITLTILACVASLLVPVPYGLYYFGHLLRERSKYAAF